MRRYSCFTRAPAINLLRKAALRGCVLRSSCTCLKIAAPVAVGQCVCVCVYVFVGVGVCARACVRVCVCGVRAGVRACACAGACVRMLNLAMQLAQRTYVH